MSAQDTEVMPKPNGTESADLGLGSDPELRHIGDYPAEAKE